MKGFLIRTSITCKPAERWECVRTLTWFIGSLQWLRLSFKCVKSEVMLVLTGGPGVCCGNPVDWWESSVESDQISSSPVKTWSPDSSCCCFQDLRCRSSGDGRSNELRGILRRTFRGSRPKSSSGSGLGAQLQGAVTSAVREGGGGGGRGQRRGQNPFLGPLSSWAVVGPQGKATVSTESGAPSGPVHPDPSDRSPEPAVLIE